MKKILGVLVMSLIAFSAMGTAAALACNCAPCDCPAGQCSCAACAK